MADSKSPERPQVTEAQRGHKVAKVELADVAKGQKPKAGAKTAPGPTSGPPMTSMPPAPPTPQQSTPQQSTQNPPPAEKK